MKNFFLLLIFLSELLIGQISLDEIDIFKSSIDPDHTSIVVSGTNLCNDYFKKNNTESLSKKFKNIFTCKFSKKRNRFYIYMLSVEKKENIPLKEFCNSFLSQWPIVYDHMDKKLNFKSKEYLKGFFIEKFI